MMKFIENIVHFIDSLNKKDFYLYLGIFLGTTFCVNGLVLFWHYNSMNSLNRQIEDLNELREEKVQSLLARAHHVRKQREEVDALLAQDPNFKLGGYVKDLLTELHLIENQETETTSQTEREEKYLETVLSMKLVNINTKQLAELLDKIEKNQRINANTVEIIRSKKKPDTIEVSITIATLQPN